MVSDFLSPGPKGCGVENSKCEAWATRLWGGAADDADSVVTTMPLCLRSSWKRFRTVTHLCHPLSRKTVDTCFVCDTDG